jgi:hypothetical protein
MKFRISLTWSKIMALIVLGAAFYLDVTMKQNSTFMFALPFIVFLITGKQFFDKNKQEK